jgi:DHA2 family multidrug resistance protein
MIVRNTQVNHADIGRYVTLANPGLLDPRITRFLNPFTSEGRAALDAVVTNQAQVIAYMDDYKMLTFVTLAMFPLILAFRAPDATSTSGQAMAH